MKVRRLYPLSGLALAWLAAAVVQGQEKVVPVYDEPHHRMVFEAPSLRILNVRVEPGQTSGYHTHDSPILYVQLSSSQLRTETLGPAPAGPPQGRGRGAPPAQAAGQNGPPRPGRVSSTTSYVERPVTHRITNVGDRLFWLIAVLTRLPGDESVTPEAAGFAGTPEFVNRWYRAYRFEVAPGAATTKHRHGAPVVIVQVTEGRAVGEGAGRYDLTEAGQWAYFDAGDEHEVRNTGGTPVELVEVEVRQGRPGGQ